MSSFLFVISILFFIVGAIGVTLARPLVDTLRDQGHIPEQDPRDRQVVGARLFGWGCVVIGFALVCIAAVLV